MKAIVLTEPGSVDNLTYKEIPVPEIKSGEVLVKVETISINPVDAKTRKGGGVYSYGGVSKDSPLILGWDISGVVTESASDKFKEGDEVFGMVNFPGIGAAYASYVAAPAAHLVLKPADISHEEAAAATLAPLTAWQVLVNYGKIKAGDRVLIHAAAGGVGHYAVQIAKHFGAYVIGTSSAANRDFVLSLGADEHIDYHKQPLKEATKDIDFVLDSLGVENIIESLEVMKPGSKITTLVTQFTEELTEKANAKGITGNMILVKSDGDDMESLGGLLAEGVLKSHISQRFSFDDMKAAHEQIESGRTVGKIVVNL